MTLNISNKGNSMVNYVAKANIRIDKKNDSYCITLIKPKSDFSETLQLKTMVA